MSETLFGRVDYSLQQLVDAIDLGSIRLPDIQRPFVWGALKVRDLFDSIFGLDDQGNSKCCPNWPESKDDGN